jgi:hypothetical protein
MEKNGDRYETFLQNALIYLSGVCELPLKSASAIGATRLIS